MIAPKRIKPANIILDLLRTYPGRGASARKIMAAGKLFGMNENLMRVNLSRLVHKGIIDNFKRGYYRLSDRADPVSDFVEEWRLGEARRKPWEGDSWLLLHTSKVYASQSRNRETWALTSNGFRMIQEGLWMRPDNLAIDRSGLDQRLSDLGTPRPFILISGGQLAEVWHREWRQCINIDALTNQYMEITRDMEASLSRLDRLPREEAMKESFNIGGTAIQVLAKDPLLPDEMQDPATRVRLWELMCEYDQAGRAIWAGKDTNIPDSTPISQTAIA